MAETDSLTCYRHPEHETFLRCNKCERPICAQCAISTPTGYRCRECVRGQQRIFENARPADYLLASLAAAGLSYLGSFIPSFIGFFTLFAAPFVGNLIAEAATRLTNKRRSVSLFQTISAAVILGSLPNLLIRLIPLIIGLQSGSFNLYAILPLLWHGAYSFLVTGSVYYRLTGIKVR